MLPQSTVAIIMSRNYILRWPTLAWNGQIQNYCSSSSFFVSFFLLFFLQPAQRSNVRSDTVKICAQSEAKLYIVYVQHLPTISLSNVLLYWMPFELSMYPLTQFYITACMALLVVCFVSQCICHPYISQISFQKSFMET